MIMRPEGLVYQLSVKEKMSVYRVQVEVLPMQGTSLPPDWAGAFVNVYVGANNIIEAIQTAEEELFADYYKPENTYSAYELDMDNLQENDDDDGVSVENIKNLNGYVGKSGELSLRAIARQSMRF